jgi:hypothetical protein
MPKDIPKRVSIKYSVDLTEVPERVAIMLTEMANAFGAIAKHTRDTSGKAGTDVVECLKGLKELINILEKSKIRVQDLSEIMLGYVDILKDVAQSRQEILDSAPPKKKAPKKKTTKKKKKKKKEEE